MVRVSLVVFAGIALGKPKQTALLRLQLLESRRALMQDQKLMKGIAQLSLVLPGLRPGSLGPGTRCPDHLPDRLRDYRPGGRAQLAQRTLEGVEPGNIAGKFT